MIVAIYKKIKPKDRWMLHSLDHASLDEAKQKCIILEETAKKNGLIKAQFVVQIFDATRLYIPEFLKEIKPEKFNYN